MIKLTSLKANIELEASGDWIDYPDWPGVAFRVRSLNYPDYKQKRDQLVAQLHKRHPGKKVPDEEFFTKGGKLYCDEILLEWRGFDIEYSPEVALEVMTDPAHRSVYQAVEWCAEQVAKVVPEHVEAA